jgi:hypothetical protein
MGKGFVHVKMTNTKKHPAPKPCAASIELDGKRQRCCAMAGKLCDFAVEGGTCDAPLCDEHAHEVGPDRHYCPIHHGIWKRSGRPAGFENAYFGAEDDCAPD